ncbi:MAG: hypothetical protein GY913_16905 [Proteobacteria bacterium]|nr:hypothetical protein [Pseudomonadota bacterium]MCP4918584.1 hypothetical protein [Pseudomonadota bacterium]
MTDKGFFGTLMESVKKVVTGFALFFLAFPLLLWNECRSVQTAKSLDEGAGLVVEVDSASVDPGNQGKLVHTSGEAKTTETLADPILAVSSPGLRLSRDVEMYQWLEREEKSKNSKDEEVTTWYYEKGWSSSLNNSSNFEEPYGHTNPSSMPYESEDWQVSQASVGAWMMSSAQIQKLTNWSDVTVTPEMAAAAGGAAKASGGNLYIGPDSSSPTVGDVRISYQAVPEGAVSLIGKQVSSTMEPYQTVAGDQLLLVQDGTVSAEMMFQAAKDANVMMTWILRFVGFMMMFTGLGLILGPVKVVADKIPLVGDAIEAGIGLFAFLVAAFLSLVTIAVSWIVARPLVGVLLLVVAVGALVGVVMLVKKARAGKAAAAAA